MNHLCVILRLHAVRLTLAGSFVVALVAPAYAQSTGTDPANAHGNWHSNVNGVSQSAQVTTSSTGVTIGIRVRGQDNVPGRSEGKPPALIREQPKGPQHISAPAISVPGSSNPGISPDSVLPANGANLIVAGGPTSLETSPGLPPTTFGGFSIGGWTFDTPGTPGITTGFAPTGPVPHIDPRSVALSAEQEFPLPTIALQANPTPGRVNIDSWFWVSGYNGSILTHSKTEHASHRECRLLDGVPDCRTVDDSVTVVVHLTPKHYEWTFGDDRNNSASFHNNRGLGRPYTDPDPRDASPVTHAYHWSSIDYVNEGGYPITLTIDWSAEFSANGGGFQGIPDVVHTYQGRHQVRQIQAILSQ